MGQVTDKLKRAIRNSAKTRGTIAKEAGLEPAALWRFTEGQTGLTLRSVDALCDYFGLVLVERKRAGHSPKGK